MDEEVTGSSGFATFPTQDLGDDFIFKSDAKSLQQILDHKELSPRRKAGQIPAMPPATSLTPIDGLKKLANKKAGNLEFFETKDGAVLFRPKLFDEADDGFKSAKKRGFGRTTPTPHWFKTPSGKRNFRFPKSEVKDPAARPLIHRQSISERKAVPHIDDRVRRSFLPRPVGASASGSGSGVRKELKFNDEKDEADFEFAKPKEVKTCDQKSLAKNIMMRESLAGMPRASLTGLFRQSLTMAELDKMFEDDSTESFENLESRLKTPAKTKPSKPKTPAAKAETPVKEDIYEIRIDDDDFEDTNDASCLMKKSKSYGDLEEITENVVVFASSLSEEDIPSKVPEPVGIDTDDPFLKEAVENLDRHRQEQAQLDNQLFKLMAVSRKRREDFKAVWGVSPRSINQKRTVKTVLNVQNVGFSGDAKEVSDQDTDTDDDEEPEMDTAIGTELFHKYIDANFTPSSKLHNFTGIETEPGTVSLDEIAKNLTFDSDDDDLQEMDMEIENEVRIDIPVKLGPKTAHLTVNQFEGDLNCQSPLSGTALGPPTTPMVLKDISNKAQKELASLYLDESDSDEIN